METNQEIWGEIAAALAKGKVEVAAAALRHHLEYVSRLLADELGASIPFRADGNYELGELLPSVLKRMKELSGKAAEAAQSWGNKAAAEAVAKRKTAQSSASDATNVEQWAVNKAVHYNEWANFGRKDFEPVVAAFRDLLGCFRCDPCDSWVYVTPRVNPEAVRCDCNLLRRLVLPVAIQGWSLTSLQQRLFKTGGRLIRHARSFVLQLAESYLTGRLFRQILGRIERLAWHPT